MKKIFTLILILFSITCYGNAIDSIKTKKDVLQFFHKHFIDEDSDMYADLYNPRYSHGTDSFYITDFDKNGLNDLIVDGRMFIVILDKGRGNYKKIYLYGDAAYKGVQQTDSLTRLLVSINESRGDSIIHLYDTSLVYKWDNLIEYNPHPSIRHIHRIEYYYRKGFCSDCPHLTKMVMNSNGTATCYYTNKADKPVKSFIRLSSKKFRQFTDMLNYVHFENLQDGYRPSPIDASFFGICTFYNNGKVKKVTVNWGDSITLNAIVSYFLEWFEEQKFTNAVPFPPGEDDSDFLELY